MSYARTRGFIDFDHLRDIGPDMSRPDRPPVGSVGVCLNDEANPPTFWELLQRVGMLGFFANIADPTQKTNFSLDDFWPLT